MTAAAYSPLVDKLIKELQILPGIGARSAQRIALRLLLQKRMDAAKLAQTMATAVRDVKHCDRCRTLTEETLCQICSDEKRLAARHVCVVEWPQDMHSVDMTRTHVGTYFVLMGRVSPVDGVTADMVGVPALRALVQREAVSEVLVATSQTPEGNVTATVIHDHLSDLPCRVSRIALGVPFGSDLEFVDPRTIAEAVIGRRNVHE